MVLLISLVHSTLVLLQNNPSASCYPSCCFEQSFAVEMLSLVDDSDAGAPLGRRCAYGQVTKRKQGHHLKRTIKLSKEHMYRLSISGPEPTVA